MGQNINIITKEKGVIIMKTALRENEVSSDWKSWNPKRGEIYLVDFGEDGLLDSEQRNLRPALVLSNNRGNTYGTVIQVAPLTSQQKSKLPIHVEVNPQENLRLPSLICVEQTRCISKRRACINGSFIKIATLSETKMREVELAIKIQFGLS